MCDEIQRRLRVKCVDQVTDGSGRKATFIQLWVYIIAETCWCIVWTLDLIFEIPCEHHNFVKIDGGVIPLNGVQMCLSFVGMWQRHSANSMAFEKIGIISGMWLVRI